MNASRDFSLHSRVYVVLRTKYHGKADTKVETAPVFSWEGRIRDTSTGTPRKWGRRVRTSSKHQNQL